MRFSRRIEALPGSRIRLLIGEVAKLEAAGVRVYGFHVGQPGLPPDEGMLGEFVNELLREPFRYSMYTPPGGIEELRAAIAEDYSRWSGVKVTVENVSVTTGSAEAIMASLMAIIDEGDEVVVMDPTYLVYAPLATYLGARVKAVTVRAEDGFVPSEEAVKGAFGPRTRAIVVINPDNPTGRVLDQSMVRLLVDLARDHGAYLIYDEAYRHLYYEGEHQYALRYDMENVVALNTFSKDPALPGWRLGYVVAHGEFIKVLNRVKQYINLNPPTPAQYLALLYLTKYKEDYLRRTIPVYKERMEAMYSTLKRELPEAIVVKPRAGLFVFPNLRNYLVRLGIDDEVFSTELLRKYRVAVIPGSSFGNGGRFHVRLSFAKEDVGRIIEGVELMARFLGELSKRP